MDVKKQMKKNGCKIMDIKKRMQERKAYGTV